MGEQSGYSKLPTAGRPRMRTSIPWRK